VLGIVHSDVETQYAGAVRHARFASGWIAVSHRCARVLGERLAAYGRRAVQYLPYPIPAPVTPVNVASRGPLRLIYLGRLEESQKRVSRLAAVLDALARRGLRFSAMIVGDGPARAALVENVRNGAAAEHVTFTGALDAPGIAARLQQSDVFLLTSAFEGLPLALLEAMAAGVCPVVMQIASGLEDALVNGANALITPAGDVAAMVAAIIELDRDREQLAALRIAAQKRIEQDFAPSRHFAALERVLDDTWNQPPPDPALVSADPTVDAVAYLIMQARSVEGELAIYGAGMFGRKLVDTCLDADLPVVAWFDSDPARSGLKYRGLTCEGPAELAQHGQATFLVGSIEFAEEIADHIRQRATVARMPVPRIMHVRKQCR
jgi:hypothetical protein